MNLLLFTQVYPDEIGVKTPRSSSVCHYWTKEWRKEGHNVIVIYCYPNYHPIFHWLASKKTHFIAQFTNATLPQRQKEKVTYEKDGVTILKIPMYKTFPKTRYSTKNIQHIVDEAYHFINQCRFKPDIILSHFDNPILEIAGKFKERLNGKVPLSFVLHGYAKDIKRLYPNEYQKLINQVDAWGFRSIAIKNDFERHYGPLKYSYICYSGIPDEYIASISNIKNKISGKICYVGALIKRKYPEKIIIGLLPFLKQNKFTLSYIGEGALENYIRKYSRKNHIEDKVTFLGQIERNEVQHEIESSDFFVMISRHETFGMVYLEAMAHGCITIASKNEGFDGIIKDGKNGFLCNAGDSKELFKLFKRIESLSEDEKLKVRKNAIDTARNFTESIVAKKYIEDVKYIINLKNKS
jgi:glycosyltransferase involved in cell wall biosynthesis